MEDCIRSLEDEHLSPVQAAAESPYTADHIGRLVREGRISNRGRKNKPLLRRGDLHAYLMNQSSHLRDERDGRIMPSTREQISRAAIIPFVGGNDG